MKKLGIVLDSFVCLSKQEVNDLGYAYIPLITEVDGTSFLDGVDVDRFDLLQKMTQTDDIRTSLPYMSTFEETFSKVCKEYDEVIYLPISSKLSSTNSAASNFLDEFPNLHIVDTSLVGDQMLEVSKFAIKHYEKYQDIDKLIEKIQEISDNSLVFILPLNIKYLVKGGRVGSFKKFLLGALSKVKLSPYVKFDKTGTSTGGIGRGPKGAIKQIISKFEEFTGLDRKNIKSKYKLFTINGIDKEFNDLAINSFKTAGLDFDGTKVNSTVVAIHTGPEAHAYSIMPILDNLD
ncbi:DegV family protein [Mycoplasma sp. ES3157-GEN-MYC]|uniref:DegV family EDD domain-containing protein n=1 Tax=Mycoplasma miroungigenitalium TaxID=754515 RepID=A0A6M4JAC7_9MOLU|nr:DegV family protein [Mycoplasma miroungigenitalium]MBU4690100.1 DegV family protein [Mycoplasma miroungigenitalium]MBU4691372.1 DegV family protein [Mycoplasma miroungigenitalium]QJR43208.1 DegV family EDD domain-containing protein [Mycoplasma miroungigenitalium]